MFLVRKVARAKWDPTRNAAQGLADGEISADAVTVDLRTQGGTLSFWRCSSGASGELEEAVLAIAAAGDRLDRIQVVWLAVDDLQADGLVLRDSPGRTLVADLVWRHVDICHLDYARLGQVARRVAGAIGREHCRPFLKKRVKGLLLRAVEQRRIDPDELPGNFRKEIGL